MCEFELPDVSLRCFVARQLLLQIYALSSVKFLGLKLRLCKKKDKYEVWIHIPIRQRTPFAAQVAEIDEILEMKVTHRKNLTRREKKFG